MRNVRARGGLWVCYGAMMCLAITANLLPVYLTTFGETFGGTSGLTVEQLGRIPAFAFGSLTLGILVSGPLADRWGAKLFAVLGLALTCVGLLLMGLAGSYGSLLAAGCILGLGAGILDMLLSPLVCVLQPHRRAAAMNWLHSFYGVGALLTALIGACALRLDIPWRAVFFVITAFPAAILVGFAVMRVPPLVAENGSREPVSRLMGSTFFLGALGAIFLAGATEQGMSQWLPAFSERVMGLSKSAGALALAAFLVALVAGRVLTALLGGRVGPVRLMVVCCILAAALFMVGSFCPYVPAALSACVAVALTVSCLWPTMLALAADRCPHGGASMFALLAAFGNAGCFVMPWVVGVVAATGTLKLGLATASVCPLVMAVVLWWMSRQGDRVRASCGPPAE